MAEVTQRFYKTGASTPYATLDDDGNWDVAGELRIDGAAVASIDTSGNVAVADSKSFIAGTGSDFSISHDGSHTTATSGTGNLIIDNTAVTGATILRLGTDTSATKVAVQANTAGADIFSVTPASATTATVLVAGTLDLNGLLDMDFALTGTGDGANIAGTMTHATQSAEALDLSIAQLTNARSAGVLTPLRVSTTSLAGDSGGTYANIYLSHTDGGGTTVHGGIYGDTALDAFAIASADGKLGFTVGAMTAKSPETDTEAGYITVRVGTTPYQIPFYAAS